MNRWRVGEDRGSKETDRCPLTSCVLRTKFHVFIWQLILKTSYVHEYHHSFPMYICMDKKHMYLHEIIQNCLISRTMSCY
jgi:hypothetical protein